MLLSQESSRQTEHNASGHGYHQHGGIARGLLLYTGGCKGAGCDWCDSLFLSHSWLHGSITVTRSIWGEPEGLERPARPLITAHLYTFVAGIYPAPFPWQRVYSLIFVQKRERVEGNQIKQTEKKEGSKGKLLFHTLAMSQVAFMKVSCRIWIWGKCSASLLALPSGLDIMQLKFHSQLKKHYPHRPQL